jgi:hypothetical protein
MAGSCRDSGLLARPICPSRIDEVFLPGQKYAEAWTD